MAIEHVAAVDAAALEQHGLLTSVQATSMLGPSRKSRWVTERRLVSVQPGVFRLAGAPETWHQQLHAAVLASGGVVSHRSAAELWGIIPPAGHLEVSILPDSRPRLRPPAVAHRILDLRPDLAVTREGMQITDPGRTIIDLGLVMPKWGVSGALSRSLSLGLLTIGQAKGLREALGRQGRNGTGIAGELIEGRLLTGGGDHSELETALARVVRTYELPTPTLQHEVWHAGRCLGTVDAAYPALKLAIEVDGYEFHSSPEAFQRDRTRQNHLVNLGWTVLRFTWHDVVKEPAMVASLIRDAIRRLEAA
jgi:very-short-patch-repair endonuclease